MTELYVEPASPLIDDVITITLQGLNKHQNVTIMAGTTEGSSRFSSFACYAADENGIICLSKQPSVSGSYTGIKPMGLFWSMVQAPGQERGRMYLKRIVKTPQMVTISVFDGHLSWNELHCNKTPLVLKKIYRYFKHESVKRVEIRHGRLRGTLFVPKGQGPFPGVIDMFGTVGGITEFRAAMFANRGFTAFALAYMGLGDLPKTMAELDCSYFKEAVEWFCSCPFSSKDGIGVCGVSYGGQLALLMSLICPQVKAVVSINGPPCMVDLEAVLAESHGDRTIFSSLYAATYNLKSEMLFSTWNTDVKILYIVGEDDQAVHPRAAKVFQDAYPTNKQHNLTVIRYPGTGHMIEPPFLPHCRESFHTMTAIKSKRTKHNSGSFFIWGGDTEQHAQAQEDSWNRMLTFFRSVLSKGKTTFESHL